jgi:23S rRNA maturation-related 3'-5' exoribonuclease YhaM
MGGGFKILGSFEPLDYDGPEIEKYYQLIISRIESLDQYRSLKTEILDLLQYPCLKVLKQCHPKMTEQLYQAGFIANPAEFQNYLIEVIKGDQPKSFRTAPGSRMTDHHSYPGGLVYHTAVDIEMALSMADVYQRIYNINLDRERLIVALALHDIAKAVIFPWNQWGEYPGEIKVAETEGHHIFSISEAIYRDFPLPVIQARPFVTTESSPLKKGWQTF